MLFKKVILYTFSLKVAQFFKLLFNLLTIFLTTVPGEGESNSKYWDVEKGPVPLMLRLFPDLSILSES
jgi:hypothetical protein